MSDDKQDGVREEQPTKDFNGRPFQRKISRMGRRGLLKTLSALGVSAATLGSAGVGKVLASVDDPKEEVPYTAYLRHKNHSRRMSNIYEEGREPIVQSISRDLWINVESAHKAANKVAKILNKDYDSSYVSVGVSSGKDKHDKFIRVMRYVPESSSDPQREINKLERSLPSSISAGVSYNNKTKNISHDVEITEMPLIKDDQSGCEGDYFDGDHEYSIPGGVDISGGGTAGTPATVDESGDQVMVSAGHVVDSSTNFQQPNHGTEDDLYFDSESDHQHEGSLNDHGYLHPKAGRDLLWTLGDGYGNTRPTDIAGVATWETIKNNEGDYDYDVIKQGNTTGSQDGIITDAAINSEGVKHVHYSCNTWGGDSGAPVYHHLQDPNYDVDEYYIVAIHAYAGEAEENCPNHSGHGNAMEYIENQLDITV